YEIIFVDDCSIDNTLNELKKIANKDQRVVIIALRRRYGQTTAMSAGFDNARGEVTIPMDADLQNDPRDISKLLDKLNEGYDVVSGWRKNRKEPFLTRRLPSMIANKLISVITGVDLHDTGCTLKAYRSEILEETKLYGEMHRFIPAIAHIAGAKIAEVIVRHHPRKYGKAKYGINRTLRVILDALTVKFLLSFQTRPMHFFGKLGVFVGGVGALLLTYLVYQRFFLALPLSSRPSFLVAIFCMLVGLQLVMTGLLAEMLTRIYFETQNKKTYIIKEKVN
ncbi:MAG: Glycosyl transferase family 2, partial [Microgenomates group bacterium GW2011_GWD1_33_9]